MSLSDHVPRSKVLHFALECEVMLAFARRGGGLTSEEQGILKPYLDRLWALILDGERYDSAA